MGNFTEVMTSRRKTETLDGFDIQIICWAVKAETNVPVLGDTIDGFTALSSTTLDVAGFSRPEVVNVHEVPRKTKLKQWWTVVMRSYRDFT